MFDRQPVSNRLKPPSWLDGRLMVGALLVLVSIAVGSKIVASSDRYDLVWAASHDIAAGSVLTRTDVEQVKVRFHDRSATAGGVRTSGELGYFSAGSAAIVGRTASQALYAGQLIPAAALPAEPPVLTRLVTVPVDKLHMPKGAVEGVQVDLYVTVKSSSAGPAAPQLVLANVTIADTITDSSGLGDSGGSGVVLSVPIADVDSVVGAAEAGAVDLVMVPADQTRATPSPGSFVAATSVPPSLAATAAPLLSGRQSASGTPSPSASHPASPVSTTGVTP